MKRARFLLPLALVAAALPVGSARLSAQAIPLDLEVGYRFVDVSGNEQMYRTQINDRPGVLLRSLNYTADGPGAFFDYLHIDGSDIGAGPAGQLRFQAGQVGLFKLTFTWRETDLYSALPAFANPFLSDGIIPGQQTWNRTRNIYDATLEFLPGKTITPLLGYTRNTYQGPGTTTYTLGGNDFQLNNQLSTVDELYRVGIGFNFDSFQASVTEGYRQFRWKSFNTLVPGGGDGNNSTPVLGRDVTASQIDQTEKNKVNTPVTNVWLNWRLLGRVKLIGSYIRADAGAESNSFETDAGNFVSFQIARFFKGLDQTIVSNANTNYWRGSARAEIDLAPNIDLSGGWAETSRELTGEALITNLYLSTVTYAGVSTGDLLQLLQDNNSVNWKDSVYDARVTARLLGPFAANAGWVQTHSTVTVSPSGDDFLLTDGSSGTYERTVNSYGGGVSFSKYGLTMTGDYYRDEANQPIFRTDFITRNRYKFRALWAYKDLFRIGGTYQETRANDDIVEIGYATTVRDVSGDLEVTLVKNLLTMNASVGEFLVNRNILIRVPQNFDIVPTYQKELGHTYGGGLSLTLSPVTLTAGYLWFQNQGSIPFTLNRARVLAECFFTKNLGATFEWLHDQYNERVAFDQAGPLANFNANRYYVGIHWRP
jgi:hypothetical protein